jgi:hypothetical protein
LDRTSLSSYFLYQLERTTELLILHISLYIFSIISLTFTILYFISTLKKLREAIDRQIGKALSLWSRLLRKPKRDPKRMPLSNIVSPAFKSILVNRLQKILHDYKKLDSSVSTSTSVVRSNASLQIGAVGEIPLNRIQQNHQICYVSAIAFRLTNLTQESVTAIATQLVDRLTQSTHPAQLTHANAPVSLLESVWCDAIVQLTLPGWIHFKFSDRGLAAWLQMLSEWLLQTSAQRDQTHQAIAQSNVEQPIRQGCEPRNSTSSFEVLYTHARCCDLLRLGNHTEILRLSSLAHGAVWQMVDPDPIPWSVDGQFCCRHPAERRLIAQMVDIVDELSSHPAPSSDRIWRLAQHLSQVFQTFYAQCSIVAVAKTDRPLAQARLGLVLLTQALLRWLLEDWLHLKAPIEL